VERREKTEVCNKR